MEIFYLILVLSGLTSIKLQKIFFATYLQQIWNARWSTHKITLFFSTKQLIKTNREPENFKATGMEGGGRKFILFLLLFLYVHMIFQYKLNSHKSLFILPVNLFSYTAFIYCFSSVIPLFFFFMNLMNMSK